MAKAQTTQRMQAHARRRRDEWVERVTALARQVGEWSQAEGWAVERHDRTITEQPLGTYKVPEGLVRLDGGELILTPIGLYVSGGDGRVDLEAIPTLARVKLLGADGGWKLYADPNVPLREKWGRATFTRL